jgi:tetratricopeptide (TPR) repeat protein
MKRVGILLIVLISAFAGTNCWAEQNILLVLVKDLQNRPIQRVELAVEGTREAQPTGPTGLARIKLPSTANASTWVTLQVVQNPPQRDLVIISPWDSRLQVPPPESDPSSVISVVMANRGDPALLENETALAAITAKIIQADQPGSKDNDAAQPSYNSLAMVAKTFGLASEDVDKAIRGWGGKADDSYQQGLAALYKKDYALASEKLAEARDRLSASAGRQELADTAFFLGRSKYQEGKYEESAAAYQDAKKLRPDDPAILHSLALSLDRAGDDNGAEALYRHAAAVDEKKLGPQHAVVIEDMRNLASFLQSRGDYAGAEPLYRHVLADDKKNFGLDSVTVATDLNDLGRLLQAQGNHAEAQALYWQARGIDEKVLGPDHRNLARDLSNLGLILQANGDYADAEPMLRRALTIDQKTFGPSDPKVGTDVSNLAGLAQARGDLTTAERLYNRALEIDEKAGANQPKVSTDLKNLAKLLAKKGDWEKAEELYGKALAMDGKVDLPNHSETAADMTNQADQLQASGDLSRAEAIYRVALGLDARAFGPDHPNVAVDLSHLAGVLQMEGNFTEAELLYRKALTIEQTSLGQNDPKVQATREQLEKVKKQRAASR